MQHLFIIFTKLKTCAFNILREITDVTITMIGSLVVLSTLIRKLLFIFIIVITNTTIVCLFVFFLQA